MAIKKNDFVEIEYTGKLKENNAVFDTTSEKVAKDNNLFSENSDYKPVIICIGKGFLLKGLEDKIDGKELGKHVVDLKPEEAFGKKDAKLIQLIPTKKFHEQQINPMPGLQLNIDGVLGTVRTVTGGRTIVDFNHPISGKDVIYEVEIKRVVTDAKEKINAVLKMMINVKDADIKVEGDKATIKIKQKLPSEVENELKKQIKELTNIEASFTTNKEEKTSTTDKKI